MSKIIHILFSIEKHSDAVRIQSALLEAGYEAFLIDLTEDNAEIYASRVKPDQGQLFLVLDALGFSSTTVDGGCYYNYTPQNLVTVLTSPAASYGDIFDKRINYTISFLVTSPSDVTYMREHFPHIYHVDYLSDYHTLPVYLDQLDWRF